MKAIILLAVLAVAAARPEAPLHGGYHNHRSNGFQSARALTLVNGNGANGQNGDNGQEGSEGFADDLVVPANGAPAPVYGPPTNGNGNGNGKVNGNGHRNGNGNGHANGNGHRNGNGNGHNGHVNGNGHHNGNGHANGNGHHNGNGNGHANGNGQHSGNGNGNGSPAPQYGPPGFDSGAPIGATEDPLAEPASYQFSYKVEDEEAGLNFGHEEAREGDEATGEYFVLLPDGRTLRVKYVANNDGYQPEITYEEPKNGGNGNGNGYY